LYDYNPRETTYEQEEIGSNDPIRIKIRTQAAQGDLPESRTNYSFHTVHRLMTHISRANLGPNQDESHSTQISPTWLQGLKAAGSTHEIYFVSQDNARYTDELNHEWKFTTNRFGQVTSWTTPLNATSKYEYNSWGELVRETGADPDGGGLLVAPVTLYGYTLTGNLVLQKHLGDNETAVSELKWTYSSTLNRPLTAINELGKVETMTYHTATGNLLTYTDRQGNVWSYRYDAPVSYTHLTLPTKA
jgi:YD repeat-containing protein